MTYNEFRIVLLLLGWKEMDTLTATWTNGRSEIKCMSWTKTIRCHLKTEIVDAAQIGSKIRHISQHSDFRELLKLVLEGKDENGNFI